MDYKKIFKTRKSRERILKCLRFVPDGIMLRVQYRIKTGRKLNMRDPERFTEKLQWYKMHYRNPVMHQCVDKYKVRDYVREKGLESILIPLISHYNSVDDVNFDSLPEQFVMKTTHGGGGLSVIICRDKHTIDPEDIKKRLCFKNNPVISGGREWAYNGNIPGLVVEKLLVNSENPEAGMNDYKIFCYNGEPKYIVVDIDRYIGHKRNFYDVDWNNLHINSDCPAADRDIPKPASFEKMLDIARKLSSDFPFVRVDLYNDNGNIYFGELTFYPWSGYVQFYPDESDMMLGKDFKLIKWNNKEKNHGK